MKIFFEGAPDPKRCIPADGDLLAAYDEAYVSGKALCFLDIGDLTIGNLDCLKRAYARTKHADRPNLIFCAFAQNAFCLSVVILALREYLDNPNDIKLN